MGQYFVSPKQEREQFRERYDIEQGGRCYYCKDVTPFDKITDDHFLPRREGHGLKDNRVLACKYCNQEKWHLNIYQFREKMCRTMANFIRHMIGKGCHPNEFKHNQKIMKMYRIIQTCTEILHNEGKPTILY
jgi:hypothetical protein